MKKNLKDYLPFYIGCNCKVPGGNIVLTLEVLSSWDFAHHGLKPLLRPLKDINNIEGKMLLGGIDWAITKSIEDRIFWNPEQFKYLLSKSFDLFNLIPEGLAIDSTTIKK